MLNFVINKLQKLFVIAKSLNHHSLLKLSKIDWTINKKMQKILRPVSKTIGINARRFFTKSSLITNKFSKSKCNFRLKFFAATTLTAAIPIASLLNSQEDQNDPLSKF